jgi:hypothetical protein
MISPESLLIFETSPFMMEEPTGWFFPDEVGRLCKMVRLTMECAGFPDGRFLILIHWALGLAETGQQTALCRLSL